MKLLSASSLIVGAGLAHAWLPASQTHRSFTSLELSTAVSSDIYTRPEKITMDDLPTVYVYDHCPFCVRVRLALGIKNIKHKIYFMANDDVQTPTSLVGKKIAPIFVSLCAIVILRSGSSTERYPCNSLTTLSLSLSSLVFSFQSRTGISRR